MTLIGGDRLTYLEIHETLLNCGCFGSCFLLTVKKDHAAALFCSEEGKISRKCWIPLNYVLPQHHQDCITVRTLQLTVMFGGRVALSQGGRAVVRGAWSEGVVRGPRSEGQQPVAVGTAMATLQVAEVSVGKDGGNDKRNDSFSPPR